MNFNDKYKITILIGDKVLTYTGEIISEDDTFVTFVDKFGATFSYNKKNIVSAEEVVVSGARK